MPEIVTFTPEAARTLMEMASEWTRYKKNSSGLPADPFTKFGPIQFRIGRTCTTEDYPTYPLPPANTFAVEFGHGEFTEEPGCRELTFTPYTPKFERVAHDIYDSYWPEGTVVYCMLLRGFWYIVGALTPEIVEAELTADLCWDDTTATVENVKLLAKGCHELDITTFANPRKHQGKDGNKVLAIRKKCSTQCDEEGIDEWQIFDVQLRAVCVVNGIDGDPADEDGCLKYGPLIVAAEFCTDGEPDPAAGACKVFDFSWCDGTTVACDMSWDLRVPEGTEVEADDEVGGCCQ